LIGTLIILWTRAQGGRNEWEAHPPPEKEVDFVPIQRRTKKMRTLSLPPIVGAVTLVGGSVLLLVGKKKG
jgi:hypothetical protein